MIWLWILDSVISLLIGFMMGIIFMVNNIREERQEEADNIWVGRDR